jgi:hypothetical protein
LINLAGRRAMIYGLIYPEKKRGKGGGYMDPGFNI